MKKAEFRQLVRNCIALAESLYDIDLGRVRIDIEDIGKTAGKACSTHYRDRTVHRLIFNKKAIDLYPDVMVNSTIAHEVAHLVQSARPDFKSEGHDYKWRSFAIALGDDSRGEVYHNMEL